MNKKFLFLLLFYNLAYSQTDIKGKLLTGDGLSIPFASIQLIDNQNTISYTTTDDNGSFSLTYKGSNLNQLSLKISHISYKTKIFDLKNFKNQILKITLEEKQESLQEVVIQSKLSVAKKRGDTLTYNLKALTTGNEEKLVDVLKKLPGIEISQDGKIISQGKVVDNLLINGKKMFGNNHKVATENINAEMLESIDLLSNYETFNAVKEIEGNNNKTALNVNIKKEFLGKVTGDLNILGAYNDKYLLSGNLFKFTDKINVASILNFNNTGQQSLSAKDYFSMNRSIRQDMRNNNVSSNSLNAEDIPSFLLSNNNVTSKNNDFISFDIAYQPNAKLSVNGFSIFSHLKTNENIVSNKTYFSTSNNLTFQEQSESKNNIYTNQTKINAEYKPSETKFWNYTLLFDPSTSNSERYYSNIENFDTNDVNELKDNYHFSLGQQLSFISKIAKNKLLSFNIFHEIKNTEKDLNLSANYNLFDINNLYDQSIQNKKNNFGFYSKLTYKKNFHIYKLSTGIVDENSKFIINSQETTNSNLDYLFLNFNLNKNQGKLNYKVGFELREYLLNATDNQNQLVFFPSINLKYNFGKTQHLLLSYNKTVDYPKANNLNENFYAKDFRTLINPSDIDYTTQLKQDIFLLNYFKFDLYNGIIIMLNSSYILYGDKISNNINNALNYVNLTPIITGDHQFSWNNSISYEQRIPGLKNKFKINTNYIKSEVEELIDYQKNTVKTDLLNVRLALLSNFDKNYFNYEIGYNYNTQNSKFSLFETESSMQFFNPYISFNGKFSNKWSYYIDNSFEKYSTQDYSTDFFNLSLRFKYKKNKITYWIEANNLLNINNPKIIKTINKNNMLSTEIIDRLSGYIGAGIKFSI